jgi:hypothetical protein
MKSRRWTLSALVITSAAALSMTGCLASRDDAADAREEDEQATADSAVETASAPTLTPQDHDGDGHGGWGGGWGGGGWGHGGWGGGGWGHGGWGGGGWGGGHHH